jgi:dienelactone hydrolase
MRNLSFDVYINALAARHVPAYRFTGSTQADWRAWRDALRPKVIASLGPMPEKVAPNAETVAEWAEDGLIKRKFVIDVEEGLSAEGYLFRPADVDEPLPGILACHGHGDFGKDPIMGNDSSADLRASMADGNYVYGLEMAKAGYAVAAIDWRGFGARDSRKTPPYSNVVRGRDPCNVNGNRAFLLGRTLLGMDVHDGRCAIDYLASQECVDPDRIGVMGCSFGGTMTTWLSLVDPRVKAADILCYSDRFTDFAMRDCRVCASQITPGLFAMCDVPDLHGLIAPRPLLVEIGIYDTCFKVESALSCYREVEKIYAAAGAGENLALDLYEGPHGWGGNKTMEFFGRHLKQSR